MLRPQSRVARKPNLPWKALDGTGIVLDLDTGDYFDLDELGFAIWRRLDGDATLAACAEEITRTHDVAADVVERDVLAFIGELLERNLVVVVSP